MSQDEVTRIRINKQSIGIIGLTRVMQEMGKEYADRPDNEVQTELVRRISKRNYVPGSAKEVYSKSLLREFNKFLGRPYEEDVSEEL